MAHSKVLLLITITLFSSKLASSFPAVYEPHSRTPVHRTEPNVAYDYGRAFDDDLLSVLPCKGASVPQQNYTRIHTTKIVYDTSSHGFVCKAKAKKDVGFTNPGNMQKIQTPDFPEANGYPGDRLYISNFGCPSPGQEPVIDLINVLLQPPLVYRGDNYCVDYVKIDPPISNHSSYFCGSDEAYPGPFHFDGAKSVQVTFRTSHRNNAHKGFCVWLHCETSSTPEEDTFIQHLQLLSKSAAENSDDVQFESLAKLVNFALDHCRSADALQVSPYWNIVKLALQYEKVDDERVQKIAQDVLQCFPPSQINFARIEMDEKK